METTTELLKLKYVLWCWRNKLSLYWPGHLNVKVLPDEFIDKCEAHYDEFIEWWKENWR